MILAAETAEGVYTLDADADAVLDFVAGAALDPAEQPQVELPLLVAAAAAGSTVVAVVKARPPLVVSHDAGRTWREAGGGLPAGKAVAIAEDDPDRIAYVTSSRIYVSNDGGRFWRGLEAELEEIIRVDWID
jgi:photosystem II stability/assembly factor-like uncharacterized protein